MEAEFELTGPIMRGKCSISSILVGTGGEGVRVEIVVKAWDVTLR